MKLFFWVTVIIQGGLILLDEFYFHWHRRLPKWEKWGHPVDTFFFLLPLSILTFCPVVLPWQLTYIVISVISSLIITKDEWIHREKSSAPEQWLHSLLFMLHPVVLITGFFVWSESKAPFIWAWGGVFLFWLYQIIFWNFYADRIFKTRLDNRQQ